MSNDRASRGAWLLALATLIGVPLACRSARPVSTVGNQPASTQPQPIQGEGHEQMPQAVAPKALPRIPSPDAAAAEVADGYRAEVVVRDLVYPSSVTFDDAGNVYVAESGYAYGDLMAPARVWRVSRAGEMAIVAEQLAGPVNDIVWNEGRLYVSQRGKISVVENGAIRDLVTDLPSYGDHHNNQIAVGADGKLYFGQGTATNSGVVGLDNVYPYLWLAFYPDVHDVSPADLELRGNTFTTPDPLTVLANQGELVDTTAAVQHLVSPGEPLLVKTGAFQPFGKNTERVKGSVKANGTVLRMNRDGSGLEVYAWGLRNPFGLRFHDAKLYVTDLGFDERGSRPIANAPDVVWEVRQGGWYGWPDFAGGVPVTDARFRSKRGEAPEFLLEKHPPVEKPLFTRPPHASPTKFDFSTSARFGFERQMFLGEFGGGAPVTGPTESLVESQVVRVDPSTKAAVPFFRTRKDALGPRGYEYAVTAGPKRPVDVRFSPDGTSLYVVDFGAMAGFAAGAGPAVRPFPGTGVLWRITRNGVDSGGPPPGRSTLAGRAGK